jgi:hypothetical protein
MTMTLRHAAVVAPPPCGKLIHGPSWHELDGAADDISPAAIAAQFRSHR